MNERRTYVSPLRAEQAAGTKEKILDALEEMVMEGDRELSMSQVAARSGVALRTVYRHYENRDALLQALLTRARSYMFQRSDPTKMYDSPEQYADSVHLVYPPNSELRPLLEALERLGLGSDRSLRQREMRRELVERAFPDVMERLDADGQRRFGALMHLLASSQAERLMEDWWGMTPEDAARACAWAILALTEAAIEDGTVDHELQGVLDDQTAADTDT